MNPVTDRVRTLSSKLPGLQRGKYVAGETTALITKEIPELIRSRLHLSDAFKVYGSLGTGNWAEIPWVALLDRQITESTQNGYYIVLLINRDLTELFVELGVGWTQFEDEYGNKEGRIQIEAVCKRYGSLLGSATDFDSGKISLGAQNNLGKGYESGAILSKKFEISDATDDELFSAVSQLLQLYGDLKGIVGSSVLNLDVGEVVADDEVRQFSKEVAKRTFKPIDESSINELIEKANNNPPAVRERLLMQIVRNKKFADFVKQRSNYVCEICGRKPFVQKNGRPYAEADHINPLGGLTKGTDHPDNMRCLCAQCHAVVTHGSEEEIKALVKI